MGSQVYWLDTSGKKVRTLTIPNPWNARWTPSGDTMFVVTYGGSVLRISGENQNDEIIDGLDAPFDIAPVSETSIWVSEQGESGTGHVCLYNKDSSSEIYQRVVCNKNVALDNPEGLWPLADGSVVVVDTGAGTLVKINPNGAAKILEENLGIPILLQVLEQGNWVIFTNQSKAGPALIFGQSKDLF